MAKIQDYNVQVGEQVMIEGTISYSRIAQKIEGEALREENERRTRNGMIAATTPFWSVALDNPRIIYASGDANNPTPMENFWANEKIYTKRAGGTGTSSEKKGQVAPNVFQLVDNIAKPLTLQGELASGSRVRIIVGTYQTSMGMGYGFSSVLILDNPVRYYEGNSIARALANYGISVKNEEANVISVSNVETEEQAPVAPPVAPEAPAAPVPPTPAPAPAAQPTAPVAPAAQPETPAGDTAPGANPFENTVQPGNPFNV